MSYNADFIQADIDHLKEERKKLKKRRAKIKDQIEQLEEELFDLMRVESTKSSKRLPLPECTAPAESVDKLEPSNPCMPGNTCIG